MRKTKRGAATAKSARASRPGGGGNGAVKSGGFEFLWQVGLSNLPEGNYSIARPATKLWLVLRCVHLKAQKIASVPFLHADGDGNLIESGDLVELWDKPNPHQDSYDFIQMTVLSWEVFGAFAWLLLRDGGVIKNIYPLVASRLQAETAETAFGYPTVAGYRYRTPSGRDVSLKVEDVVYCAQPDPYGGLKGVSALNSGGALLAARYNAERMNAASMANRGVPPAVLEVPPDTSDSERDKLKADIDERWGGIANAQKVPILPSGVKVHELAPTFAEMEFIEGIKMQDKQICAMMGVPYTEIFPSEGGLGRGTEAIAAGKQFWQTGLFPIMSRIEAAWRNRVVNASYGRKSQAGLLASTRNVKERLQRARRAMCGAIKQDAGLVNCFFDIEQIDVFFEERLSRVEAAVRAVNNLRVTPNAAIRAFDLPFPSDTPAGDVVLVPFNLTPFDSLVDKPEPPPTAPPEQQAMDKAIKSARALAETKLLEPDTAQLADAICKSARQQQAARFARHAYLEHDLAVRKLAGHLRTFFFNQRKSVLARIEQLGADALSEARDKLKSARTGKAEPGLRMDFWAFGEDADTALLAILQPSYRSAARAGSSTVSEVFKLPTVPIDERALERVIKARAPVARSINETTSNAIKGVFDEWAKGDAPVSELFDGVRALFNRMTSSVEGDQPRNVKIATTEAGMAFNFGVSEGARRAGAKLKAWMNNPRPTMRETHDAAKNKYFDAPIPFDEDFEIPNPNGGVDRMAYPRDPSAPPEQTVNCQCILVPVFT